MRLLRRSYAVLQTFGLLELFRRVREYVAPPQRMTLHDIARSHALIVSDPCEALTLLADDGASNARLREKFESYLREWQILESDLNRGTRSNFPAEYDVEGRTAQILYLLVRLKRPKIVLETGIARGFSTFAMLSAVKANGVGIVHSCDVDPTAGEFVTETLSTAWEKHLIDGRHAEMSLTSVVNSLDSIDFFFHDSNHRAKWMEFEFETVLPKMSSNAVLGSDDVDLNCAFLRVIPASSKAVIVLDRRKASGFAIVNQV